MSIVKRLLRALLAFALLVFIIIQFFHPPKNDSGEQTQSIATAFPVPDDVAGILKTACNDCHSNNTIYPWYASVQPVAWWLDDHIKEGKDELNFSAFASYSPRRQYKKFSEIKEQLEEDEMPIAAYAMVHRDAKLNAGQKNVLINWSLAMKDTLSQHYPMDSLVRRKN